MPELSQSDTELILSDLNVSKNDSNLGYFSKPFRVNYKNQELIIKKYLPVSDDKIVKAILENHDSYISELKAIGIKIPETLIREVKTKNHSQIIIIQEAFLKEELLRNRVETSPEEDLTELCKFIFDETIKFVNNRRDPLGIGFHPTLRNFALRDGVLYYFDSFPPMLMNQRELNKVIIRMSPFGQIFRKIIPLKLINLVSDEYYSFEKMFTGIAGSFCRLRPESNDVILAFSREYIERSNCSSQEKQNILKNLNKPPDLPLFWTFFRRISGNVGKPNVKLPQTNQKVL